MCSAITNVPINGSHKTEQLVSAGEYEYSWQTHHPRCCANRIRFETDCEHLFTVSAITFNRIHAIAVTGNGKWDTLLCDERPFSRRNEISALIISFHFIPSGSFHIFQFSVRLFYGHVVVLAFFCIFNVNCKRPIYVNQNGITLCHRFSIHREGRRNEETTRLKHISCAVAMKTHWHRFVWKRKSPTAINRFDNSQRGQRKMLRWIVIIRLTRARGTENERVNRRVHSISISVSGVCYQLSVCCVFWSSSFNDHQNVVCVRCPFH